MSNRSRDGSKSRPEWQAFAPTLCLAMVSSGGLCGCRCVSHIMAQLRNQTHPAHPRPERARSSRIKHRKRERGRTLAGKWRHKDRERKIKNRIASPFPIFLTLCFRFCRALLFPRGLGAFRFFLFGFFDRPLR